MFCQFNITMLLFGHLAVTCVILVTTVICCCFSILYYFNMKLFYTPKHHPSIFNAVVSVNAKECVSNSITLARKLEGDGGIRIIVLM